jgi:hypothetical protein
MYNPHRGLGPAPGGGNARLNELLDGIRAEFESQARASSDYEHSSKCGRFREPLEPAPCNGTFADMFSGATNPGDANGSREGLLYGTDTFGTEAEVRVLNATAKTNIDATL